MFKYILLLLIPLIIFAEDDLSLLLSNYESQSQLYKKTKDESAGHLIIYSRKDLDRMQAQVLKDVLKSVRYFSVQEGTRGNLGLQRAGAACTNAGCIRVYVNDQEMSSSITGSALMLYGEYDLGHVDHIEVYLGGSALKFGHEYGFVSIKIYTKDSKREDGGFVGTSYATDSSFGLEAFHAGVSDDIEYLLYAKKKDIDKGKISNQGYEVPRYSESINIFASLKKENDYIFEVSSYEHEHDAFAGLGIQKTPTSSYSDTMYRYISFTKYFDTLKFKVSYAQEENGINNIDDNGIMLYDRSVVNELDTQFKNDIYKLSLEDSISFENSTLLYGIDYQKKCIDYTSGVYQGINGLSIYSGYLEYEYNFDDNNLFVATGKYEHYEHHGYDRNDDLYQGRLGLVSLLSDDITFKAFYSQNYIFPATDELIVFPMVRAGSPDLKAMKVGSYSAELIYIYDKHQLGLMYMQMNLYDPIHLDKNFTYYNKSFHAVFDDYALDYSYNFDRDNKLMLEYYFSKHNRPADTSSKSGGYVKLFNTLGLVDIYNEFVFREGYLDGRSATNLEDGYDWTVAITYNMSKEFTLAFKGENLLDKSIASPVKGLYPIQSFEQRFSIYANWYY